MKEKVGLEETFPLSPHRFPLKFFPPFLLFQPRAAGLWLMWRVIYVEYFMESARVRCLHKELLTCQKSKDGARQMSEISDTKTTRTS